MEESQGLSKSIRALIKSEVKSSIKSLKRDRLRSPDKDSGRWDPDSELSDVQPEIESGEDLSSDLDSSDEDTAGKSFFPPEDIEPLLKAVKTTMQLEDTKESKSIADQVFDGLGPRRHRVFSVHKNMEALIRKEWKNPDRKFFIPNTVKRKYPFEETVANIWDKAPAVDAPVAKIAKKSDLPFDDLGGLGDPLDKKADIYLRRTWECASTSLRPAIAASWVSRSLKLWLCQLENHIREKRSREDLLASLPTFHKAADFLADASTDAVQFSARAAGMSNAARRAVWLRSWRGDQGSKARLCSLPCEGSRLFGTALDDILERASDNKKRFPIPQKNPFFRKRQSRFKNQRSRQGNKKDRDRSFRKPGGFLFKPQENKSKDKSQ